MQALVTSNLTTLGFALGSPHHILQQANHNTMLSNAVLPNMIVQNICTTLLVYFLPLGVDIFFRKFACFRSICWWVRILQSFLYQEICKIKIKEKSKIKYVVRKRKKCVFLTLILNFVYVCSALNCLLKLNIFLSTVFVIIWPDSQMINQPFFLQFSFCNQWETRQIQNILKTYFLMG